MIFIRWGQVETLYGKFIWIRCCNSSNLHPVIPVPVTEAQVKVPSGEKAEGRMQGLQVALDGLSVIMMVLAGAASNIWLT